MKENDITLTFQETEQLCRLYMDCRLSVREETELQYILSKVEYYSRLIDDVRGLMGIAIYKAYLPSVTAPGIKRHRFRKWLFPFTAAAAITMVFIVSLVSVNNSSDHISGQQYYVSYVDGQRLSSDAAKLQIEEKKESADRFIREMTDLEAREREKIDNFFNL